MFGPDDYKDYINAERQTGMRNPLVRVELLLRSVKAASQNQFLSYSIIPVNAQGGLAASGSDTAYIAMPHVFVRPNEGCGQRGTEKAKAARLKPTGFANDRDRVSTAQAILSRIVSVYGLPSGGRAEPTAPEPPRPVARPATSASPKAPVVPAARPASTPGVDAESAARRQPIACVFGDTLERGFPLVLVVGREGNNSGTVVDFVDRYNWEESNRSAFWTSTYTYFARICGLGTATDTKRIVSQLGCSPIVFANAAGIVIPNAVSDKERLRAAVHGDERQIHVQTLFAHEEITSRLAFVILSGLDDGASLASKRLFEEACRARSIPVVNVPYFYGTNLGKIAAAIGPSEERTLRNVFEAFLKGP